MNHVVHRSISSDDPTTLSQNRWLDETVALMALLSPHSATWNFVEWIALFRSTAFTIAFKPFDVPVGNSFMQHRVIVTDLCLLTCGHTRCFLAASGQPIARWWLVSHWRHLMTLKIYNGTLDPLDVRNWRVVQNEIPKSVHMVVQPGNGILPNPGFNIANWRIGNTPLDHT